MCPQAGWGFVVSHRSGELRCFYSRLRRGHGRRPDQNRLSLPQRANRQVQPALLEIEAELGKAAVFGR